MDKSFRALQSIAVLTGFFSFLFLSCCPPRPLSPAVVSAADTFIGSKVFDHSHHNFDLVLKKFVVAGSVDYRDLLEESDLFYEYLDSLAKIESNTFDSWTRAQQLAFWINAYNAFTLQAVLERYPIVSRSLVGVFFPRNSILQISGVWTRLKFHVVGQLKTLDQIEHDIIRKEFGDARIHFAIVCASRSCPALRSEAYKADILDSQLDEQAFRFINDPERGLRLDTDKRRLYLSKIFKWFKNDFEKSSLPGDVSAESRISGNRLLAYIRPYIENPQVRERLADGTDLRISYLHYDWRLNDLNENGRKP